MIRERETALMLMDLWAFAYSQNPSKKTLREFETACRIGDNLALPEVKDFRELVNNLNRDRSSAKAVSSSL